jgi:hypothetical protein
MSNKGLAPSNLACLAVLLLAEVLAAPATISPRSTTGDNGSASLPVGENLTYRVEWNPPWYAFLLPPMDVGQVTLSLAGETQYKDKKALKITFSARSSGALAKFLGKNVDDSYEFITEPETFCTYCVSKREREGKRMRDLEITYLPDSHQVHIREVDVSTAVPRVVRDKDYDEIPPCVKDPFSALYALRRTDFAAGTSRRVLVGENERVKEAQINVEKSEQIHTPAGDFQTWLINAIGVFGGLFKNKGQFRIWLTTDDRKMPVKFEAKVSIGKITGNLVEARN